MMQMQRQFNNPSNSQQDQDPTYKLEECLKVTFDSLDKPFTPTTNLEFYQASILPQLTQQPRIIINGTPFGSKPTFQQVWSKLPATQHQVSSFDCHLVPSSVPGANRQFIILVHLKVRFDESGKTRLGDSADLLNVGQPGQNSGLPTRPAGPKPYSRWFGATVTIVADENIVLNFDAESISSFDYRITEAPENSVFII
ncbi:unnamed protein product [Ambrosiozyma monospora]|uniref:Unnamed protein product n=1 Tax=Ambrosiozyma monospora TaxID=43982 RepID=A0ACB5TC61_AMBMO|nr:unnamed protein product [Ambrosiozyma monospora]